MYRLLSWNNPPATLELLEPLSLTLDLWKPHWSCESHSYKCADTQKIIRVHLQTVSKDKAHTNSHCDWHTQWQFSKVGTTRQSPWWNMHSQCSVATDKYQINLFIVFVSVYQSFCMHQLMLLYWLCYEEHFVGKIRKGVYKLSLMITLCKYSCTFCAGTSSEIILL